MLYQLRGAVRFILLVAVTSFILCVANTYPANAASGVNPQISFQGKVVKSDGTNIADGTYNMEFKIYQDGTSTSGGTLKWTEDRLISGSAGVAITSGTFQVNLGSITSLSSVDFNQNTLWLSLQVGNTSSCTVTTTFQSNCGGDGEMSPYIRMSSTPYALNADKLDGIDSTGFVQLNPSSAQSGAINVTGNIVTAAQLQAGSGAFSSTGTGSTISITQSGNPAAGSALLFAKNTNASPSGNLIDLQNSTASVFNISSTGQTAFRTTTDSQSGFVVYRSDGSSRVLTVDTEATIDPLEVQVGSSTSIDGVQVNLGLDSSNVYTDQGTCGTSTNQGALYYNTASATVRGCVNGSWEDLATTGGLGLLAFGVIPDSANAGSPGDLAGITPSNSPCKVYWSATSSVTVAPCYAYSGGRKVAIPSTVISTSGMAASTFANICLSGTGNQPLLLTANATETSAAVPTWSANNPVLCLATVGTTTTAGTVGKIFDIRAFTTTQKSFATLGTAMALGTVPVQSTTANILGAPGAASAALARGVIIAYSGATSTTAANVILATAGPQWVKASGTSTVAQYAQIGATNGYAASVTAPSSTTNAYAVLGVDTRTIDTTCTSNTTCQFSQFLNPLTVR